MEDFLEIDRKRMEAYREAGLIKGESDRQLFRYVGVGLGIFLAIVAIASLILLF